MYFLTTDEELKESEILSSVNNKYFFTLEYNGNLVIYKSKLFIQENKIWSSFTNYSLNPHPFKLKLHSDGNLVLIDAKKHKVWSSNTAHNNGNGNYYLIIQDNGRLAIMDGKHDLIWESRV
jgi:hypothetical protein